MRRHSCAASSLWPPSWYDERTYWTSVASQRRWTLSQPTYSISDAVVHMQMHHESPAFGSVTIVRSHCHAFWLVSC